MLRTEDRPTVARESKHMPAPVNPSKRLAEITNCSSCLSWQGCWSKLGWGGAEPQSSNPLPQSVVSQRRWVTWEPAQDPVWMFLSVADSANWFHAWKCPKRRGNQLPSLDLKGVPLPYPRTPRVQVKFASERIGIFHKIDCDHYIIRNEYLRNFSHEKIHTSNTPPPKHTHKLFL